MNIEVYGAAGCGICETAKQFLEDNKIKYKYIEVGTDMKVDDFVEKFETETVPVIVYNDRTFYGFSPFLKSYILKDTKGDEENGK